MPELKHPENTHELLQILIEATEARDPDLLLATLRTMSPHELDHAGDAITSLVMVIAEVYREKLAQQ